MSIDNRIVRFASAYAAATGEERQAVNRWERRFHADRARVEVVLAKAGRTVDDSDATSRVGGKVMMHWYELPDSVVSHANQPGGAGLIIPTASLLECPFDF